MSHSLYLSVYVRVIRETYKCSFSVHLLNIFTALHGMQTRSSNENSVRLSVFLSVRQTRALWQNQKICPDFSTIRKTIYPTFLRRRIVGGERPLLPEI